MTDQDKTKKDAGTASAGNAAGQQADTSGKQDGGAASAGNATGQADASGKQDGGKDSTRKTAGTADSAENKKTDSARKNQNPHRKAARRFRRRRTARRALIVVINVLVIILFWYLVWNLLVPVRAYRQAERLVSEHEYEKAEEAFADLAERLNLPEASGNGADSTEGTGSGAEDSGQSVDGTTGDAGLVQSVRTFLRQVNGGLARLGGFADAADRVNDTRYQEGVYLRTQGSYAEAIGIFEELGDYLDSAAQISETRIAWASTLADGGSYTQAIALLEKLGSYESETYGSARTLLDRTRYTLAGKLTAIGKLDDAETLYSDSETYQDSYEKLRDLRYNMARNALLLSDFETAKSLLSEVGDFEDAKEILTILDSAVDRVYMTNFTDITGTSTNAVQSCIWMHSVIVPGRLDEGISVKMQEDLVVGGIVNPGIFGSASYDYNLEQVRDNDTWYFTYYGSDTEDSGGAVVLQADFGANYSSMTTKKVYVSTRNEEEEADARAAEESAKVAEAEDDNSAEISAQEEEGDDSTSDNSNAEEDSSTSEEADEGDSSSGDHDADSSSSGKNNSDSGKNSADETDADRDSSDEENSSDETDEDSSDDNEDEEEEEEPARLEFEQTRNWTEVTDQETASQIKEGFRVRRRIQLAENGNMYFYNWTDDSRLPHYCSETNCLNEGVYKAEDLTGRRYYCEDHYEAYTADSAYRADEDPKANGAEETTDDTTDSSS